LKTHTITVLNSICAFMYSSVCFIKLCISAYIYIYIYIYIYLVNCALY
jgi:hypothetical protein